MGTMPEVSRGGGEKGFLKKTSEESLGQPEDIKWGMQEKMWMIDSKKKSLKWLRKDIRNILAKHFIWQRKGRLNRPCLRELEQEWEEQD